MALGLRKLDQKSCWTVLCFVTALLVGDTDADAVHFNYHLGEDGGPDQWYKTYPDCGGVMQSPIDIDPEHIIFDPYLQALDFSDYKITDDVEMTLENKEGQTAELVFSGRELYLQDGNLPDKYLLQQIHFHWGQNSTRGSEHSVNGQHYPMELHIVHTQRRLQNITVAAPHPFGLAVLSYMFKIGKKNENYEPLLKYFKNITNAKTKIKIPTFPLYQLLPVSSQTKYYRYDGSLTTPPCHETVIWTIATETIEISEEQLDLFRKLYDDKMHPLVDDYRPVQKLNKRTILTSDPRFNQATTSQPVTWLLLVLATFIYLSYL